MSQKSPKVASETGVRWTPDDVKLLTALRAKLGVGVVQILRIAIRTLAKKENV